MTENAVLSEMVADTELLTEYPNVGNRPTWVAVKAEAEMASSIFE
jgi:hypothetical protein